MTHNAAAAILPVVKNDKRITSAGRVLRTYYLDEVPPHSGRSDQYLFYRKK